MDFAYTKNVTRRRSGRDDFGDPIPGGDTVITGCVYWPWSRLGEAEGNYQASTVIDGMTLIVPPGTDVTAQDQFLIEGNVWDVEGEIARWESPFTGWTPGDEVKLRRATG